MYETTWPWVYLGFLLCGTVLSLLMISSSTPTLLVKLAKQPFGSPNHVSVWRLPIIALGQCLYIYQGKLEHPSLGWLFTGFLLVVAGLTLDRLDGKQAKAVLDSLVFLASPPRIDPISSWAWYSEEIKNSAGEKSQVWRVVQITTTLQQLSEPNTILPMFRLNRWTQAKNRPSFEAGATEQDQVIELTGIGEWLDPMIDKLNFHPVFLYLAYLGCLNPTVVFLMLLTDLIGTVIRAPFDKLSGFRALQQIVGISKATAFGKIKVVGQFITLLSIMPVTANWLSQPEQVKSYQIASGILLLSLISGLLSVLSRLVLMDKFLRLTGLSQTYNAFNKRFEH
ncbi:hypothetical protein IT412_01180 [Candidatus Peregrinibacteria bacterium]|nr:hypothetical protein [Candidatus Peregrinibacteria bacterium]